MDIIRGKVEIGFFSRSGLDDGEIRDEARRLFGYGFKTAVLTRGSKGSCAYDGNNFVFQEITPVELVDPLGAGDAYMGAFLSKYISKKPIDECMQYAADYSATVCGRFGGF